ncbi:MAG: hypothetical protein ACRC5R_00565 [Mycoplasmatales bacterium]
MSTKNREERIKKSLEKEIYSNLNQLDYLDDDTFASTEKLANILDGYMTKVDDLDIEDNQGLEILDEMEINIEANDENILNEYNEKIHEFGLDTLNDILATTYINEELEEEISIDEVVQEEVIIDEEVEKILDNIDDTISNIDQNSITQNFEQVLNEKEQEVFSEAEFTQTIESPDEITNLNDIDDTLDKNKTNKNKLSIVDYILFAAVIILIIIIIYIFIGGVW